MGWGSFGSFVDRAVNSVKKTVKQPTRIITKPITVPIKTGIQYATKAIDETVGSKDVGGLINDGIAFTQSDAGKIAMGAGITYMTGNPQFAAKPFLDRKQKIAQPKPQVTSGQVRSGGYSPGNESIYTTQESNITPIILIGVGLGAFLLLKKGK